MPLIVPAPIATERLIVRAVTAADLPDLLVVNGDDDVTRYLPYASWQNLTDAQAWLDRSQKAEATGTALQFVIVLQASGRVVGSCLLFRHDEGSQRVELGYVMGRAYWRSGFMHEALTGLIDTAFGAMGLRLVTAEVDTRNAPSIGMMGRLGFTREGVLRQRWVAKGEARDTVAFGLLKHEWRPATTATSALPSAEAMPALQLDRLDHLVLTVQDVGASTAFYERVLGMRGVTFGAGRNALEFGRQKINLHPASAPIAPHAERPTRGSADLCFILATPLAEAIAHLQREGVAILEGPVPRTGALGPMRSVYFRDLDGNLIEVSSYDDPGA